jgi:hypothetical protein
MKHDEVGPGTNLLQYVIETRPDYQPSRSQRLLEYIDIVFIDDCDSRGILASGG